MFEWWVIFTLISLFSAGLQAFYQKVGVINNYNSFLLNSLSAAVSVFIIGFVIFFSNYDFKNISWLLLLFAILSGSLAFVSTNLRMESLKHIDTTISLPIHKFISPLFVLFISLIFFNESLSYLEWIGIIIGMCVPLLLINNNEKTRQSNLKKGVILITISGLLSAMTFALNRLSVDIVSSVIIYMAITQIFMTLIGFILYKQQKPERRKIH